MIPLMKPYAGPTPLKSAVLTRLIHPKAEVLLLELPDGGAQKIVFPRESSHKPTGGSGGRRCTTIFEPIPSWLTDTSGYHADPMRPREPWQRGNHPIAFASAGDPPAADEPAFPAQPAPASPTPGEWDLLSADSRALLIEHFSARGLLDGMVNSEKVRLTELSHKLGSDLAKIPLFLEESDDPALRAVALLVVDVLTMFATIKRDKPRFFQRFQKDLSDYAIRSLPAYLSGLEAKLGRDLSSVREAFFASREARLNPHAAVGVPALRVRIITALSQLKGEETLKYVVVQLPDGGRELRVASMSFLHNHLILSGEKVVGAGFLRFAGAALALNGVSREYATREDLIVVGRDHELNIATPCGLHEVRDVLRKLGAEEIIELRSFSHPFFEFATRDEGVFDAVIPETSATYLGITRWGITMAMAVYAQGALQTGQRYEIEFKKPLPSGRHEIHLYPSNHPSVTILDPPGKEFATLDAGNPEARDEVDFSDLDPSSPAHRASNQDDLVFGGTNDDRLGLTFRLVGEGAGVKKAWADLPILQNGFVEQMATADALIAQILQQRVPGERALWIRATLQSFGATNPDKQLRVVALRPVEGTDEKGRRVLRIGVSIVEDGEVKRQLKAELLMKRDLPD